MQQKPKTKAKPEEVKAKPEEVKAKPEEVKAKPEEVKAKPEEVKAKPEEVKAKPEKKRRRRGKGPAGEEAEEAGRGPTVKKGGGKVQKRATQRTTQTKTTAARKQRSCRSKKPLDVSRLCDGLRDGDDMSDGPPGLVTDESDTDELNLETVNGLDDMSDDDGAASKVEDHFDDPPLLELMRMMINQLPQSLFLQLCLIWKLLSDISQRQPLGAGSGCSGSGLDWMTVLMLSEVSTLSLARVV